MTQQNQEGQGSLENFEATLEGGFEWLENNRRIVGIAAVSVLALGGLLAVAIEWSSRQEAGAQVRLSQIEKAYLEAMGAAPGQLEAPEPANADQATQARETALAGYDEVIAEYGSRTAGLLATLRAAELEIGLERSDAAVARLELVVDQAGADELLGATANRLLGFVYEELEQPAAAAGAYQAAASAEDYPGRETAWLAAAETYLRAGDNDAAVSAFRALKQVDAEYAAAIGADSRLEALGVVED